MNKKLVSVVVPVYNVEKYLDRCVESIINQTYDNIEIILVDDGSPDNCPKMCDEWAEKDSRIKVVHKENGGLTSARKAGFDICGGDYVIFFDSDDYVDPDMIEEMLNKAVETGYDMTLCSYYRETSELNPIYMGYDKEYISKEEIRDLFILPIIRPMPGDVSTNGFICTKLYKMSAVSPELFLSEREYFTEDILFNSLMALKINGIAIINKPLYHYCENESSLTNKYREDKFEIWNKRTAFFEKYFEENGWSNIAKNRLIVLNLVALLVGADNEILKCDKSDFKKKCKYFKKEIKRTGSLKIRNTKFLNKSQKIIFVLYYFNLFSILYYYRKKRVIN